MTKGLAISSAPFLLLACSAMLSSPAVAAQDQQGGPIVILEMQHDVSPSLRDIAIPAQPLPGAPRLAPLARPTGPILTSSGPDVVAQKPAGTRTGVTTFLNFDGQNADGVAPPDTNGAVGAKQFVQWVNL